MVDERRQVSIARLKREARRYREQALLDGESISHSAALERIAKEYGFRDWNTASAVLTKESLQLCIGQQVTGRYLGHSFQGELRGLQAVSPQTLRVEIAFDSPIDVVGFSSFSAWRRRIRGVIGRNGRSIAKISTGEPHLVIDQMRPKPERVRHGK